MKTHIRCLRFAVVLLCVAAAACASSSKGTVLCPVISGKPAKLPFAPHEGWIDVYAKGDCTGVAARIGKDGKFEVGTAGPAALVASFDQVETLPIIVPKWPAAAGSFDVEVWGDYVCVPAGYPKEWENGFVKKGRNYFQTFKASSTSLYGCSVFDGPKAVWWGNKVHVAMFKGGPDGEIMRHRMQEDQNAEMETAHHSDYEFPYAGWRHGEIETVPGGEYTVRVCGYRSHGGERFILSTFARPDKGDGYADGELFLENKENPTGGDLCLILQGNSNGQIFESNVRSEEWDIRLPQFRPAKPWGQSFLNHGKSMCAVVFWASNGSDAPISCKVRIKEEGPYGKVIGPTKTANGHATNPGPFIRYPKWPGPFPQFEEYYRIRGQESLKEPEPGYGRWCKTFQVAFVPDEVPLEPGKTYYIELEFSDPALPYADGDYYHDGFLFYNTKKLEKHNMFHSPRGTLAGQIVTYQNPGGAPNGR